MKKNLLLTFVGVVVLGVLYHFTLGTGYKTQTPLIPDELVEGEIVITGEYNGTPFLYTKPYTCADTLIKNRKLSVIVSKSLSGLAAGNSIPELTHTLSCTKPGNLIESVDESVSIQVLAPEFFPYKTNHERRIPSINTSYKTDQYDQERYQGWFYNKNNEKDINVLDQTRYTNTISLTSLIKFQYRKGGHIRHIELRVLPDGALAGMLDQKEIIRINQWIYHPTRITTQIDENNEKSHLDVTDPIESVTKYSKPSQLENYKLILRGQDRCMYCFQNPANPFCSKYGVVTAELSFDDQVEPDSFQVRFVVRESYQATPEDINANPNLTLFELEDMRSGVVYYDLNTLYDYLNGGSFVNFTRVGNVGLNIPLDNYSVTQNGVDIKSQAVISRYGSADLPPNTATPFVLSVQSFQLRTKNTDASSSFISVVKNCQPLRVTSIAL